MARIIAAVFLVSYIAGCSLAPQYNRPAPPIPGSWPAAEKQKLSGMPEAAAHYEQIAWKEFVADPKLRAVIETALAENRDLRLAALNVERARALYGIKRAELLPAISGTGSFSKQRIPANVMGFPQKLTIERYDATLGISSWEIDFFGKIRNLKKQALEEYLATEEARRAAQVSLVAQVAKTYLALGADRENLDLARSILAAGKAAYDLVKRQHEAGLATSLDLLNAKAAVEGAKSDVARYEQAVAIDRNMLDLLAGTQVPEELLPESLSAITPPKDVFAGVSSEILLNRPDVIAAEHRLKGTYAYIGAARAAFFPSISLTTSVGTASTELSGLFDSGSGTWLFAPKINIPVFDARTWPAYRVSKAERDIALAAYEKTIQGAFREVADALASQETLERQLAAQQAATDALAESCAISYDRYKEGLDSYLKVIDTQTSLYAARQALVSVRLAGLANRVTLYAALGGGADREEEGKNEQQEK